MVMKIKLVLSASSKNFINAIKMFKNVLKRLPRTFYDFFFLPILMERIILTGSAYE